MKHNLDYIRKNFFGSFHWILFLSHTQVLKGTEHLNVQNSVRGFAGKIYIHFNKEMFQLYL